MKQLIAAMNAVMKSCGYVQKGGKNAFHGYKYAGEADLLERLRPALVEHGLILIPSVTEQSAIDEHGNTRVRIEYTLAHVSGEVWPTPIVAQGCGNDRNKNGVGEKGVYKAITGANKYLLFKLFQIETGDDPEASDPEPAKKPAATATPPAAQAQQPVGSAPNDWETVTRDIIGEIAKTKSGAEMDALGDANKRRMDKMPHEFKTRIYAVAKRHRESLMSPMAAG